ncbi:alcohol dehydrogenase catalytic domain-containing protein [Arenibacter certesii]|nr:alcohol dehydrogenase catalytic domain-containing protein [Arenibacter certesii]
MIKAKAIIANGKGTFSLEDIEVGLPQNDEVLVEIKAAGVCHTDYDSYTKWGQQMIMGHEGAGVVLAVGNNVKTTKPGDQVILNWAIPCGSCFQCKNGSESICELQSPVTGQGKPNMGHVSLESTLYKNKGVQRSFNLGTMSTHTIVKEAAVFPTPNIIPLEVASIMGCGVMTGVGSVINVAKVTKGSTVVVLGTGGVGLNVIQGARISGAAKIIAIDINEERLKMSTAYGATHTIIAEKMDVGLLNSAIQVKKLTENRGADYSFECTGVPSLGAAPLAMIRNGGMAVQVSGIEEEIKFDMNLFEWDKIYINPLYGKCRPNRDFPMLLDYYKKGSLLLDKMITQTYTPNNLENAFSDMLSGKNAKGVILF